MADGTIDLNEPGTVTKQLDTTELVVATVTVQRERQVIAGAADDELADVRDTTPGGTDFGVVTRNIPSGTQTVANGGTFPVQDSAAEASLVAIEAKQDTIIGHVDSVEGILTTIDADTGGILTAIQIMDDWDNGASDGASVSGDVAHDSPDAGEPVKIGMKAAITEPAAVTADDRVNALGDLQGRQVVREAAHFTIPWTAHHVPAANTQATISKSAGAGNIRWVCTGLTVMLVAGAAAPAAIQLSVSLIDGASGGGTYLWRAVISLPAAAGASNGIALAGLWLVGSRATAMTLEFSAAGGANTVESVSMSGVQVTE